MTSLYQPIKRHGGKAYLAPWILSLKPRAYATFCEPYFGGGSVLLHHNGEGVSEVVNDLDGELMTFWAVLANPLLFGQFEKACRLTPFSKPVFEDPESHAGQMNLDERVERALCFFIRARQSRQGLCKDFATLSKSRTRRGMNEQVSQWLGAVEGLIDVHARMERVVILNDDALKVIEALDHPETWFYIDPPYVHSTRSDTKAYGQFEVTDEHHVDLLMLLSRLTGRFSLSGYSCTLYEEFAEANGWRCERREIDNKASSAATKPTMTECLWMNY